MPAAFHELPENALHLILGGFTPTEWRQMRFVNRRFNSVALVRHRAAVRSIKFDFTARDSNSPSAAHAVFPNDAVYQTANIFAWVPLGADEKSSELRALTAFSRKRQLLFSEFSQMVVRFCPQLNHVKIEPQYMIEVSEYRDYSLKWDQAAMVRLKSERVQNLIRYLNTNLLPTSFVSLDMTVAFGAFTVGPQQQSFYIQLSKFGFLRHLTLHAVFVAQKPAETVDDEELNEEMAIVDDDDLSISIQRKRKLSNEDENKQQASATSATGSGGSSSSFAAAASSAMQRVARFVHPAASLLSASPSLSPSLSGSSSRPPSSPQNYWRLLDPDRLDAVLANPEGLESGTVSFHQPAGQGRARLIYGEGGQGDGDDRKIDAKPWLDEINLLLDKLPSTLESLTLDRGFKIAADSMHFIAGSCPNLTRLGIGKVDPFPADMKLDLEPIIGRLTHLVLFKTGPNKFFWNGIEDLDGPCPKLKNLAFQQNECGNSVPSRVIADLPKLFPNLETFYLGCYGNSDGDRTAADEWCAALRRMQRLRQLYLGPEVFTCYRSATEKVEKWHLGDPLALTDDRMSKLQISSSLEVLSMPYARGKCTKYALMSLLAKFPNLRMLYYPVVLDMKDTLFFNHYVLAWLEHKGQRKSLTILVDDIEEVYPNDLEKFREELRSDLRMEFRNFYQQETFCHCKTLKLAQTVRVWKVDEPQKWLCITNACPEAKEPYFCSRCSDEDD